jgi:hypothetical protein
MKMGGFANLQNFGRLVGVIAVLTIYATGETFLAMHRFGFDRLSRR